MPSYPCHFWKTKSVFFQILHHPSLSWKITPLYIFRSNVVYTLYKRNQSKCKFLRLLIAWVKIHEMFVNFETTNHFFFSVMRHNSSVLLPPWNLYTCQQKNPVKVQIWLHFPWAVESMKFCILRNSFCLNHTNFLLKVYRRVISHDSEEWCKVKEKLTCGFKYEKRNLVNFHETIHSAWKCYFDGLEGLRFKLQKHRGVIFHDTEQWCNIWINSDLVASKIAWWIGWTFIRALKSLKKCTLMSSFWPKHIMFQLENFRGIMCQDTEGWSKVSKKTDSLVEKWHKEFLWEQFSSDNLHFDRFLLFKAYKVLNERNKYHDTKDWCKVWRKTES